MKVRFVVDNKQTSNINIIKIWCRRKTDVDFVDVKVPAFITELGISAQAFTRKFRNIDEVVQEFRRYKVVYIYNQPYETDVNLLISLRYYGE